LRRNHSSGRLLRGRQRGRGAEQTLIGYDSAG
jgi:hypothetical protein